MYTVKRGLYESELYEILDYTIFCPIPANSPLISYIKSASYTKPGLYDRFSRSQPKIYLVYTNFRYGLRGKIAHLSAFPLFCFYKNADFFFYFVNLRFYVNCLLFLRDSAGT